MANQSSPFRRILYLTAPFCAGLLLIAVFLKILAFDPEELSGNLRRLRWPFVGLILLSTFFNFWITATKWKLVTARLSAIEGLRGHFLFYTGLTALVSQFIPAQVGTAVVRSSAMRLQENISIARGLTSTLYDQLYDFLIPLILLLPSLLAVLGLVSPPAGIALSAIGLALAGLLGKPFGRLLLGLSRRAGTRIPLAGAALRKVQDRISIDSYLPLMQRRFILMMYALSAVRYANLAFRSVCVVFAVGYAISPEQVVLSMPVIMLSFLISITPGGLGVREWGWVGLLVLFHVPAATASQFAIMERLLILLSIAVVNAALFAWLMGGRLRKRLGGGDSIRS